MRNQKSIESSSSRSLTLREVVRLTLCLALLLGQNFLLFPSNALSGATAAQAQTVSKRGISTAPPQTATPPADVNTTRISPVSVTSVNFTDLAAKDALRARAAKGARTISTGQPMPVPGTINDSPAGVTVGGEEEAAPAPRAQINDETGGPLVPSPTPSTSYQGEFDEAKGGGATGSFTIPPDTNGAVGLNKVFVNVNNNYVIQDKATGARQSVVSVDTFWAPTGGTGFFDPQIQYDPYNNRWILAIASNSSSATTAVEVALSQTSDPAGAYTMYRFNVGSATLNFADFPMLGYNQNFVAVAANLFNTAGTFTEGRVLVLDYPQLRAGTASAALITGISSANGGFCFHPVTTFSQTEPTLYFVSHLSSASATYKVSSLTGTPAAPTLTIGATKTRTGGGWTQPGGDILPQTCVGTVGTTCPATLRFIDSGDSYVRSNPAFRNGNVYYSQTIGLPAGGLTRTAAQWTVVDAVTGNFADGGRVDDPTATSTNGGKWYAYPSITANKNGDILMGFSQFASNQFAAAGYTFRLISDAPGTMRDPNIYKAGEDYYSKTFSGTRNRWGDYSHTLVDPVNDRDMWTLQEYANPRTTPDALTTTNNSRWATWWANVAVPPGASDLKISEFRVRGPNGANDEFVELYNNNDTPLTINTLDGSAGYSVVASDGVARFTVPNGTVIPARGHYLGVNSVGYSLASNPAGNGTTATGDATYTTDIVDNAGIALFNTATVANFTLANRLDAVGSTSEANTLYKEGTGYPALTPFSIDYSFYRSNCPNNTSTNGILGCLSTDAGRPKDSNVNAADFVFVDTNGTSAGAGQRLGAPGPENLSSPVQKLNVAVTSLDPGVSTSVPPNRVRDFTSDPANNSTFGTLAIRRTVTNNTGASVTRLRFRIIDFTTFPVPSGTADLRARTSGATPIVVTITGPNAACPANSCAVQQTTLEQPPSQPNGGAYNSTLSAGTVTLATPILNGQTINVNFLLGIQQTGGFRFFINVEALP